MVGLGKINLKRYQKSADLKTRKIKEGKLWSSKLSEKNDTKKEVD
jgi:hypothetical protein